MNILMIILAVAATTGYASSEEVTNSALARWRDNATRLQTKIEIARTFATNGMPVKQVISMLGTNYTILRPFSTLILDWTNGLTRTSRPTTCSLLYRFADGDVEISTTAGIGGNPTTGFVHGVGGGPITEYSNGQPAAGQDSPEAREDGNTTNGGRKTKR